MPSNDGGKVEGSILRFDVLDYGILDKHTEISALVSRSSACEECILNYNAR